MTTGSAVRVRVPGDKSITHRALLLAALADGPSRLRGLLSAADPMSTAWVLRALGIDVPAIPSGGEEIVIRGRGLRGLRAPADSLDCGNSGTTARLLLGLLAGQPLMATLTGDVSLRARPMRRVTEPLAAAGARFEELGEPDRLPIRVSGGELEPIRYAGPRASAQVKSALLLAGVSGGIPVDVSEPAASRDHSERMLAAMGAHVDTLRGGLESVPAADNREESPGRPATGGRQTIRLDPPTRLEPLHLEVPGDFSSAAFFIAQALLAGRGSELRIERVGVNPTRTGLLRVLERMGADIRPDPDGEAGTLGCIEPSADLGIRPRPLKAARIAGEEIPAVIDEIPVLAVLAARAEGETRITGANELRVKESDRLAALAANLRAIGVEAEELPDGLAIIGTDAPLEGRVRSFGDHRIAMAFGVLAVSPGTDILIHGREAASVSHPAFWKELERIAHALGVE